MERIGVIGFGAMGGGIAQVFAQAGHEVTVVEANQDRIAAGRSALQRFMDVGVERGKLTDEQRDEIFDRVHASTEFSELADAGIVVEAVTEARDVKVHVLRLVSDAVPAETVMATNTSALSVSELAAAVPEPQRVAGLHFFNPAQLMPVVEVVAAVQTDERIIERLCSLMEGVGKAPVRVKDRPGFLVNRLLMPYLNDVVQAFDDGIATADEIDRALKMGLGYRMGPLELLDMIGLDVHRHATASAYEKTLDPQFAPPPLLQQLVAAGYLGRKSGRGLTELEASP